MYAESSATTAHERCLATD